MMTQKPLKFKISITIDETLIEQIRFLAENDGRSVSQYINLVIRQHINKISENKV